MNEKTWLDEYHDAMKAACERKKTRTKGVCEDNECYGLGWCNDCLDVARKGHTMTQHERIIDYMQTYGSITPYDAFIDLGITKLSTRIGELKREGVKIEQRREKTENRFGQACQYTRYWLAEFGEDAMLKTLSF